MMAVRLLRSLSKVPVPLLPLQQITFFSSNSALTSNSTDHSSINADEGRSESQYRLKFTWNSANFVGTVEQSLKLLVGKDDIVGAYTFLRVKVSPESDSTFRIMLKFLDEMAESFRGRLIPDDFIYVAGTLEAFKKTEKYGKSHLNYQLTVRELKYITQHDQGSGSQNYGVLQHEGEAPQTKYMQRMHLWQMFFHSPYEWWDNRKRKSNPKQPDFSHKDTGEALWLWPNDPPWIKKQLELLDAKMVEKDEDGTVLF